MAKKSKPSADDDDWALWQKIAGETEPLPGKKVEKAPPKLTEASGAKYQNPKPDKRPAPPPASVASAPSRLPELRAGEFAGLDKRTAQRLKRGQLAIEGRLDLHHKTQAEAHQALDRFINESVLTGRRTVIVITGKGLKPTGEVGVLRTMVPRWLNQTPLRENIVAFCEAAPKDGGSGALYLRLKKFG